MVAIASAGFAAVCQAQAPTTAVVVQGSDDAAAVREPLLGALRARGYEPLATDSVDAAIALALGGQPVSDENAPQLREAIAATTLYFVQLRPTEDGALFFSLQRVAEQTETTYGRTDAASLADALVQQLLSLEDAAAHAHAAAAPSDATTTAQAVEEAANEEPHVVAVSPGPQPATEPSPPPPPEDSTVTDIALGVILAGVVFWPIGGIAAAAICDGHRSGNCGEAFLLGTVPLAGWALFAFDPPSGPNNDLEIGIMVGIGAIQIGSALVGAVIMGAATSGGGSTASAAVAPYVTPDGSGLSLMGQF